MTLPKRFKWNLKTDEGQVGREKMKTENSRNLAVNGDD